MSRSPSSSTTLRSPLYRWAEALSYILHPAVFMLLTVLIFSSWTRGSIGWGLLDVAISVIGLLPGLLFIYINVKRGNFGHYHLLLKEERRAALPILFVGMLVSLSLYVLTGAPYLMLQAMAIGLLGGIGAILITRFWKISLHAAVAMGCSGLCLPFSWLAAGVFAALGLLAGAARLSVRHHTGAQVVGGWIYGFCLGSLLSLWLQL